MSHKIYYVKYDPDFVLQGNVYVRRSKSFDNSQVNHLTKYVYKYFQANILKATNKNIYIQAVTFVWKQSICQTHLNTRVVFFYSVWPIIIVDLSHYNSYPHPIVFGHPGS